MTRVFIRTIARSAAYWPKGAVYHQPSERIHGKFRTTWQTLLDDLDRELWQVGAGDVTLQIDCPEQDIGRNGMPRADARIRSPGVVLRFDHGSLGRVEYPCDLYVDWWSNLRAISLTLNALRAVDRYGVTSTGQQYAGFRQLPDGSGRTPLTPEQAADIIADASGMEAAAILEFAAVRDVAIARALRATHPDSEGGSADNFDTVKRAEAALAEPAS